MRAYSAKKILFLFFWIFIAGFGFVVAAQNSNESGNNLFSDFDQDGLTNDEESQYKTDPYKADTDGDGYSDYAEITTGYNPLKPAPGDKVIEDVTFGNDRDAVDTYPARSDNSGDSQTGSSQNGDLENAPSTAVFDQDHTGNDTINLTNQVSEKLQVLLAAQSSDDNSESGVSIDEQVNTIIQDVIQENTKEIVFPEINEADILVKKQNYQKLSEEEKKHKLQQDTEEYITAVAYILAANSPEKVESGEDAISALQKIANNSMNSFLSGNFGYVDDLSGKGEKIMQQMKSVEVPENMLESHKQGLQFAQYASNMKDSMKPTGEDPIRDIINLSQTQGFMQMFSLYSGEVFSNLKKAGISDGMSLSL